MTEYDVNETAIIECIIRDEDNALANPDSVVITVLADSTTLVDEASMTNDSTGVFHYDYLTTLTGRHFIWIKATQDVTTRVTIKPDSFEVIPSY